MAKRRGTRRKSDNFYIHDCPCDPIHHSLALGREAFARLTSESKSVECLKKAVATLDKIQLREHCVLIFGVSTETARQIKRAVKIQLIG